MEFGSSLADTIIKRVGEKKEAWLVFDMDETLAYWKKQKTGDVFSLRPSVIPFLQEILDADIKIHFAIYSNTHAKSRVETIASTIGNAFEGHPLFHICFLFYNNFKGNPTEAGLRRLSLNTNVSRIGNAKRELYDVNKTVESIIHGYAETDAPLAEEDVRTHLFFFDDVMYPSIKNVIEQNYIHMLRYTGEEAAVVSPKQLKGTKRNRSPQPLSTGKKQRGRKTRRNRSAL